MCQHLDPSFFYGFSQDSIEVLKNPDNIKNENEKIYKIQTINL